MFDLTKWWSSIIHHGGRTFWSHVDAEVEYLNEHTVNVEWGEIGVYNMEIGDEQTLPPMSLGFCFNCGTPIERKPETETRDQSLPSFWVHCAGLLDRHGCLVATP